MDAYVTLSKPKRRAILNDRKRLLENNSGNDVTFPLTFSFRIFDVLFEVTHVVKHWPGDLHFVCVAIKVHPLKEFEAAVEPE